MPWLNLSEEQVQLLKTFADAYADTSRGTKESIMFSTGMGVGTEADHHAFPNGEAIRVSLEDLEELDGYGLIRIRHDSRTDHAGTFSVTGNGYEAVEQIEKTESAIKAESVIPTDSERLGLDWETAVLPVLKAVHELYPSADPNRGVGQDSINEKLGREKDDPQTGLVLRKLEENGYVQGNIRVDGVDGPLFCEPAARALELLAGWPTERGDAAFAQFIAALEKRIENASDEEEKTRLQRALTSVREVGQGVMVAVLSDVITGG